ncbi:MAG: hypothetical protein PWP08_1794 [Methanofollis sp.]|nr:hypothetical protein [Methanofollis sp.]
MVVASLRKALGLLVRMPLIWTAGIVAGIVSGLGIYLGLSGDTFFAGKILLIGVLILPFFVAGSLGAIKRNDGTPAVFLEEGKKHYFRVLLPAVVVLFAVVVTTFLVAVPLSFMAGSNAVEAAGSAALGVLLSFALFAYFYDTAAVGEGLGVFASIQRSAAFVLTRFTKAVLFYVANLAVLLLIGFGALFFWTALLYDRLAPLAGSGEPIVFDTINATAAQLQFAALLGPDGIWVTALVYAVAIALFVPFALAFKATFYEKGPDAAAAAAPQVGEYDEKGRWYRY